MNETRMTRREALAALAALAGAATLRAADSGRSDLPDGAQRVCLSLRVLETRAEPDGLASARPPAEAATLAGIGRLEGYYVDRTGPGDLVLFGQRSARPSLHLDDLIVNLLNVSRNDTYPRCSLDPLAENVQRLQNWDAGRRFASGAAAAAAIRNALGPQQVMVAGVPRNSRHAHIMIDADYHMKQVSQGRLRLPGVSSYLDLAIARGGSSGGSLARFWFSVAQSAPSFEQDRDIVWLDDCRVRLLTEKQILTPAGLVDDQQQDDPLATEFAAAMSREFARLSLSVPVYAQLENLFRLRALLLASYCRGDWEAANLNAHRYLRRSQTWLDDPMPESLPAVSNHRVLRSGRIAIVCGGVGMGMNIEPQSFRIAEGLRLSQFRHKAQQRRPSPDALAWVIDVPA
jgi:hypothetical protein